MFFLLLRTHSHTTSSTQHLKLLFFFFCVGQTQSPPLCPLPAGQTVLSPRRGALKEAQCESRRSARFLHMFPRCVLSLVCTLRSHRSVPKNLPPRLSKQAQSRLAGASAVTSPIHPSLDACQPGAARAVSMETSNKRAPLSALPSPFTCVARRSP